VRYLRSMPEAVHPLPVTRHCGFPSAVKAGVGGSAAAHHASASVDTITRASSCRATQRPSCTLKPCLWAPTATGRAPGRIEAVHLAKIAFTTSFQAPWRPPQVSNTVWEKYNPIRHTSLRFPGISVPPCAEGTWRRCRAGAGRGQVSGGQWSGPPRGPASRPMPSAGRPLGVGHSRRCPHSGHAGSGLG